MLFHRQRLSGDVPDVAARTASEMALEVVNAALPTTIGGSADLTGSNKTRTKGMKPVARDNHGGNYIHYDIRAHGKAAMMNGIALHGGFVPYGGTLWEMCDNPMFDLRDARGVVMELEDCRRAHPDTCIRINASGATGGLETVRLSFIVNRPAVEPTLRLTRTEVRSRTMDCTLSTPR
jgi:Ribulose bisphosphate carboxylase, small chain/Transketolase, pyrimidine binding domain